MTRAEKTINLPRAKDLKSNKLEDIQTHLGVLYDALDKAYRLTFQDIYILKPGTAVGQIAFWDGFRWVNTEITEARWDDTEKRLGINQSVPTSALDVNETVTVKRLLGGGISEF